MAYLDRHRAHDLIDEFIAFFPFVTEEELLAALQPLGRKLAAEEAEAVAEAEAEGKTFEPIVDPRLGGLRPLP